MVIRGGIDVAKFTNKEWLLTITVTFLILFPPRPSYSICRYCTDLNRFQALGGCLDITTANLHLFKIVDATNPSPPFTAAIPTPTHTHTPSLRTSIHPPHNPKPTHHPLVVILAYRLRQSDTILTKKLFSYCNDSRIKSMD